MVKIKKKIKEKIIFALKDLEKKSLNLTSEGNVSLRIQNGFIISPSGIIPEKISPEDIVFIDLNGKIFGKSKPSSEWKMHLLIYQKKKRIKAIVHSHSTWASTLSCSREKIPFFHYMVAELGGEDIKCSKYATFGTNEISKNVISALEDRKGCLMANHGQITIGESMEEALSFCESIEKLSKQYLLCKLSGKVKIISKNKMKEVIKLFGEYKSRC